MINKIYILSYGEPSSDHMTDKNLDYEDLIPLFGGRLVWMWLVTVPTEAIQMGAEASSTVIA